MADVGDIVSDLATDGSGGSHVRMNELVNKRTDECMSSTGCWPCARLWDDMEISSLGNLKVTLPLVEMGSKTRGKAIGCSVSM